MASRPKDINNSSTATKEAIQRRSNFKLPPTLDHCSYSKTLAGSHHAVDTCLSSSHGIRPPCWSTHGDESSSHSLQRHALVCCQARSVLFVLWRFRTRPLPITLIRPCPTRKTKSFTRKLMKRPLLQPILSCLSFPRLVCGYYILRYPMTPISCVYTHTHCYIYVFLD